MNRSPVYSFMKERIELEFQKLEKDKVTPWAFLLSEKGLKVTDFFGRQISYEGVEFEGSPRIVFWNGFIQPFLNDITSRSFSETRSFCQTHSVDSSTPLEETASLLKTGISDIYRRMADIDQRLCGKGYPNSVPKYDPRAEIEASEAFVKERMSAESALVPKKGRALNTMMTRLLIAIEILAVCIALVFGILWIREPTGPFEPVTFMALLVGSTIVEIIRRRATPESSPSLKDLSEINRNVLQLLDQIKNRNDQMSKDSPTAKRQPEMGDDESKYLDDVQQRIVSLLSHRKKLMIKIETLSRLHGIPFETSNVENACRSLPIPQTLLEGLAEVLNYTGNIQHKDEADIQLSDWVDGLALAIGDYLDRVISDTENKS